MSVERPGLKKVFEQLTKGLLSGYVSKEARLGIMRGAFKGRGITFVTPEGFYEDQWFVGDSLGGGQELVKIPTEPSKSAQYTRLYAGGTIAAEELEKFNLGIKKKDILDYLKTKLQELGTQTRLTEPCEPELDGSWQYKYTILQKATKSLPLTLGRESISYNNLEVFAHGILLYPIE